MPGTTDYHVMFPLRWRLLDDSFSFALAARPDNVGWNFVPGGQVCEPGETGTWVGGAAAPGPIVGIRGKLLTQSSKGRRGRATP